MLELSKQPAIARDVVWKLVYIAEAHAMDEWPILSGRFNQGRGAVVVKEQPRTARDRCGVARRFGRDFGIPLEEGRWSVIVDDPEEGDKFESEYAPWPLRLYLVRRGKVDWIAQPKDCSYVDALMELQNLLMR
mmetsp:Transcript_18373/g.42550  ORF Transcript_18373/g.42550 Transcript_18373/m.42550 type:complete len:133 (+) Transcript_18373:1652-2050(+)